MERKVIIIAGATCTGKTGLSILLAQMLDSFVVSTDSRQFYRYMDIGTAKPEKHELERVKHYFIDILEPDEYYNVSMFENDALAVIRGGLAEGKTPITAGGSGLYIKALTDGIFESPKASEEYKQELLRLREENGNEFLYKELEKQDPVSASKMLPQNWKRVIRALEVLHAAGEPIWKQQEKHKRELDFVFARHGLMWDREVLYRKIEERVDKMIEAGLVRETENLLNKGYPKTLNALNTVGYKEIIEYLEGKITLDRAVELIKRNTRRYAKRQITWFKADERIKWHYINSKDDLNWTAEKILKEEEL